jgi:hypothetical protein
VTWKSLFSGVSKSGGHQITMKVSSLLATDTDTFNQHLVKSLVVANPFRRVSTQQLLDGILLRGRRNGKT